MKGLFFLFLVACGGQEPPVEPPIRPVRTEVAESGTERVRALSGAVRAGSETRLSFKVSGTVEKLAVKVGDRLKAGDEIAHLDAGDYELSVQEARAGLLQARAGARTTSSSYERTRELYASKNAAKAQLDRARADHESAQALQSSAAKRLELAKSQVEYTRLVAAVDCAVADVRITEGENVSPGTPVVVLTSGDEPEVGVAVPESLIGAIGEGDEAKVHVDALPNADFTATVIEVGVSSTSTLTTFPVTLRIDGGDPDLLGKLRPGMVAEVSFVFLNPDDEDRVLVSAVAVGEDRDGRYAYVVQATSNPELFKVERREVQPGELTGEGLEIIEGVTAGELVVTAGISKLSDGMEVRLLPGAAP